MRTLATALALAAVSAALASEPAYASARPPVSQPADQVDRHTSPKPRRDAEFVTLTRPHPASGEPAVYTLTGQTLPLRVKVEKEVADRYGLAPIRRALESWNGVAGSRFEIKVAGVVNDRQRRRAHDGINRVFFDDEACEPQHLAFAHLSGVYADWAYGTGGHHVVDADIGLCRRLDDDRLHATLHHEVLHVAGLDHLDDRCRILHHASHPCQQPSPHDHEALRWLYPTLPRLAGPTRVETAARVAYLSDPAWRQAPHVVVVDGWHSAELAVAAATLAGVLDAPLLLAGLHQSCTDSAAAQALNRIAATHARVWLAGPAAAGCESVWTDDWGLRTTVLQTPRQVGDALADHVRAPRQVFVVRTADHAGELPDGITAGAVAGRLGAPLLFATDGSLTGDSAGFLDHHSQVTTATIIGGPAAVPESVEAQLRDRGLTVRRLHGATRIETALAVAHSVNNGSAATPVLVTTARTWADAVAASPLAARRGWPLLLAYPDTLPPEAERFLRRTADGGYLIGGDAALTWDVQRTASIAADS